MFPVRASPSLNTPGLSSVKAHLWRNKSNTQSPWAALMSPQERRVAYGQSLALDPEYPTQPILEQISLKLLPDIERL